MSFDSISYSEMLCPESPTTSEIDHHTKPADISCSFKVTDSLLAKEKFSLERQQVVCGDEDCFVLEYRNRRVLKEAAKDCVSKDSIDDHKDQLELPEENYFGDISCCTSLNTNDDSDQVLHNQEPKKGLCIATPKLEKEEDLFESYFGDVSRNNSMSTCASELQAAKADNSSNSGVILVRHFTRSASSRYLNKRTSSKTLFSMTSIDSEHPNDENIREVNIKVWKAELSHRHLIFGAVVMTMLCVIGILNPLALCCTIPGYYCAASSSQCHSDREATCRARAALLFLIATLLTPLLFYGGIAVSVLMFDR